jgi:RNA polymerase sigma factor (TIGR02999 family)
MPTTTIGINIRFTLNIVLPPPVQAELPSQSGHGFVVVFSADIAMDLPASAEVTGLLKAWGGGDHAALHRLTSLIYDELRRLARRHLRNEQPGNTLQATALVNEVYLRLVDVKDVKWLHRAQFFAIASQIMRNILIDAARSRGALKRGGGIFKIDVDPTTLLSPEPAPYLLALDAALTAFAQVAPRQAKVVELRYFGGMTEEQAAAALGTSLRTVRRDWQFAKAWLHQELDGPS